MTNKPYRNSSKNNFFTKYLACKVKPAQNLAFLKTNTFDFAALNY